MKEKISFLATIVNLILAVSKIGVGIISKSSAVIAEGIHSGMDIISSFISFIGIKIAKKPVDKEHPYGHYKSEIIAGLFITIILLLTAIWIIYDSILGFFSVKEIVISTLTLGVMAFSTIINEIMARIKMHYGKKEESIALIADAQHSRIDVFVSLGVFIALFFIKFWVHLDSLIALIIGIYIFYESIGLGKQTTYSLLDVKAEEEIEEKIKEIVKSEGIKLLNFRTRKLGPVSSAEIEIELSPKLSVNQASIITKKLQEKLTEQIPSLKYITIQIKTHEIKEEYFKPEFGRGFGWRGRFSKEGGKGAGPVGECVCPKCKYKIPHKRGFPCMETKCPKCGTLMTRG